LGGVFHNIQHGIATSLSEATVAPVDEVVHHDDIMSGVVVWPRSNVAGLDLDQRDAGVIKLDAEEG
jgi:hypothetical protein